MRDHDIGIADSRQRLIVAGARMPAQEPQDALGAAARVHRLLHEFAIGGIDIRPNGVKPKPLGGDTFGVQRLSRERHLMPASLQLRGRLQKGYGKRSPGECRTWREEYVPKNSLSVKKITLHRSQVCLPNLHGSRSSRAARPGHRSARTSSASTRFSGLAINPAQESALPEIGIWNRPRRAVHRELLYCFSSTSVRVIALPSASVPLPVMVIVLPSRETTVRKLD